MSLSIITVSHNSGRHLQAYVRSFLASGSGKGAEIEFILVENSGRQEAETLLEPLRQAGHSVTFLQVENHGFGHGCNVGAANARGDTLIFVNPDVEFIDSLDPIDNATNGSLWGTVAQISSTNELRAFDALPEYKTVLGEFRRTYRSLDPNFPGWKERIYPIGSFFIVDRSLFESLRGFDERFFMYFEEAELARRLHQKGLPITYFADLKVLHVAFGSEESKISTARHEAFGLLTYAKITNSYRAIFVRAMTLGLLSPFRKQARQRLRALIDVAR
jgi:N-acetylglucosaminyl-diphospho-decaprenol L-rhamnosyltransferase